MADDGRLDRLRSFLNDVDVDQAVLSHPETLASLVDFYQPFEDWPVSNPFAPLPAVLVLKGSESLLVPAFYEATSRGIYLGKHTVTTTSANVRHRSMIIWGCLRTSSRTSTSARDGSA